MTEIPPLAGVPEYPVLGESLPSGLLLALVLVGLLMAAAATWLGQPMMQAKTESPMPQLTQPILAGRAAFGAVLVNPAIAPEAAASAAGLSASSAAVPKYAKPACPVMVSIFFPVGATVPEAKSSTAELALLIDWAKLNPNARIAVEGHADVVGLDQANLLLSYERAKTVASLLSKRGIAAQQIQIAAAGSHSLVEGLPGDAQANRRVTVHLNDPDGCQTASQ